MPQEGQPSLPPPLQSLSHPIRSPLLYPMAPLRKKTYKKRSIAILREEVPDSDDETPPIEDSTTTTTTTRHVSIVTEGHARFRSKKRTRFSEDEFNAFTQHASAEIDLDVEAVEEFENWLDSVSSSDALPTFLPVEHNPLVEQGEVTDQSDSDEDLSSLTNVTYCAEWSENKPKVY